MWSDAARAAALEARRASAKAKADGRGQSHAEASASHRIAAERFKHDGHSVAAEHHQKMADLHGKVAASKFTPVGSISDKGRKIDAAREREVNRSASRKTPEHRPGDIERPQKHDPAVEKKRSDDSVAAARSAAENRKHPGTQDDPGHASKAGNASAEARHATAMARKHGTAEAHQEAAKAHKDAAQAHRNDDNETAAKHHDEMASKHEAKGETSVQRENREAREFLANKSSADHRGGKVDNRKWENKEWKAKSDVAHAALKAEAASKKAHRSSGVAKEHGSKDAHAKAAEHHHDAAEHHHEAAAGHEAHGEHEKAEHHEEKAKEHEEKAKEHEGFSLGEALVKARELAQESVLK